MEFTHYVIVAVDSVSYEELKADDEPVIKMDMEKDFELGDSKVFKTTLSPHTLEFQRLLLARLFMLIQLLNFGFEVIISDADTVWISHPFGLFDLMEKQGAKGVYSNDFNCLLSSSISSEKQIFPSFSAAAFHPDVMLIDLLRLLLEKEKESLLPSSKSVVEGNLLMNEVRVLIEVLSTMVSRTPEGTKFTMQPVSRRVIASATCYRGQMRPRDDLMALHFGYEVPLIQRKMAIKWFSLWLLDSDDHCPFSPTISQDSGINSQTEERAHSEEAERGGGNEKGEDEGPIDLTIRVLVSTFTLPDNLQRLLDSLRAANYFKHRVNLQLIVEKRHPAINTNYSDNTARLRVSDAFLWPHGSKHITFSVAPGGMSQQWIESWWPTFDYDRLPEFSLFIDSSTTFEVSPLYFNWLKNVIHKHILSRSLLSNGFGEGDDFSLSSTPPLFISLQPAATGLTVGERVQYFTAPSTLLEPLVATSVPGIQGLVVSNWHWRQFRIWHDNGTSHLVSDPNDSSRLFTALSPIIKGKVASNQWLQEKVPQKLWLGWLIRFLFDMKGSCIYPNLPDSLALVSPASPFSSWLSLPSSVLPFQLLRREKEIPGGNARFLLTKTTQMTPLYDLCGRQVNRLPDPNSPFFCSSPSSSSFPST